MKVSKSFFKVFSLFAAFIFFFFMFTSKASAIYDSELNKVLEYKVDRTNNNVTVSIQYQYGLRDLQVYICNTSAIGSCAVPSGGQLITRYADLTEEGADLVNTSNEVRVYTNNAGYSNPAYGLPVGSYANKYDSNGKENNEYVIMVRASFCTTRNVNLNECLSWTSTSTDNSVILIDTFDIRSGLTNSSELNTTIAKVLNITNSIVIPVLWVLLGVLLIVRGIILAVDIVKSSDEPEVRKKKISGAIWLVIGVFVGYAVTIGARLVMNMFGYGGYF